MSFPLQYLTSVVIYRSGGSLVKGIGHSDIFFCMSVVYGLIQTFCDLPKLCVCVSESATTPTTFTTESQTTAGTTSGATGTSASTPTVSTVSTVTTSPTTDTTGTFVPFW